MKKLLISSKLLTFILIAVLIASLFAGCGSSNTPAAADSKASAPAASAATDKQTTSEPQAPKEAKGTINIWTWEPKENQQKIIDDFNKDNPDIKVEFNNVASADMPKKLQTAMAAGSDLPDVAWMEIGVRGKLISLDCWEDLTKYGADKNNILEYMMPLSTNEKGELVGIEVSPAFAG